MPWLQAMPLGLVRPAPAMRTSRSTENIASEALTTASFSPLVVSLRAWNEPSTVMTTRPVTIAMATATIISTIEKPRWRVRTGQLLTRVA